MAFTTEPSREAGLGASCANAAAAARRIAMALLLGFTQLQVLFHAAARRNLDLFARRGGAPSAFAVDVAEVGHGVPRRNAVLAGTEPLQVVFSVRTDGVQEAIVGERAGVGYQEQSREASHDRMACLIDNGAGDAPRVAPDRDFQLRRAHPAAEIQDAAEDRGAVEQHGIDVTVVGQPVDTHAEAAGRNTAEMKSAI